MELILLIFAIWYAIGLFGSVIGSYTFRLSWEEEWDFFLFAALLGPINFIVTLFGPGEWD